MASPLTYSVDLYIYDLTRGMASQFAPMLLGAGFELEGVWHTSVVVHGIEWFFGGGGIENVSPPGSTMLGSPLKTQRLGSTQLDMQSFRDYLEGIGKTQFAGNKYDLFTHNCNNFSHEVALFLCPNTAGVPSYILDLPGRILQTPLGSMLKPMIEQMTPHGTKMESQSSASATPSSNSGECQNIKQGRHIPVMEVVGFRAQISGEKLINKLSEFNSSHTSEGNRTHTSYFIANEQIAVLRELLVHTHSNKKSEESFENLWNNCIKPVLLTWPKDQVFPVLDLLRWQICKPDAAGATIIVVKEILDTLLAENNHFLSDLSPNSAVRLILQLLANIFLHSSFHQILLEHRECILAKLNNLIENVQLFQSKMAMDTVSGKDYSNLEVAISTIALNFSIIVAGAETQDKEEAAFQLISALGTTYLEQFHSVEGLYRTVVAIGNLLWIDISKSGSTKDLAQALDVKSGLSKCRNIKRADKLTEATTECDKLLS